MRRMLKHTLTCSKSARASSNLQIADLHKLESFNIFSTMKVGLFCYCFKGASLKLGRKDANACTSGTCAFGDLSLFVFAKMPCLSAGRWC